jgi:quercetin dioxygenase-like cupin family protein
MSFKNTKSEVKFVPKGWGFEKWVDNRPEYCGKLLFFVKGKRCSLHYHKLKTETFYIHSGKLLVLWSDNVKELEELFARVPEAENTLYRRQTEAGIIKSIGPEELCERTVLEQGDTFFVPTGRVHQMIALEDTELFEFSTQHFDSDSHRIVKGD